MPETLELRPCGRQAIVERWLPLIAWLAVIAYFSTDSFRATTTHGLIVPFLIHVIGLSEPMAITVHGLMRKAGHVAEYAFLAFLAVRSFSLSDPRPVRYLPTVALFVLSAASADELHQSMTASRSGTPLDVAWDFGGGVAALWFCLRRS